MAKVDKVFDAAVRRWSSTGSKNTRRRAPPWPWRRGGGIGERSGRRRGGRRSKGAGGWTWTWQGTTTQASVRNLVRSGGGDDGFGLLPSSFTSLLLLPPLHLQLLIAFCIHSTLIYYYYYSTELN
uniref:Uncharacterized protein n=1 Tax=Oryza barthii TaxID=65489 RepID=A0A0D3HJR5_9ORYZ